MVTSTDQHPSTEAVAPATGRGVCIWLTGRSGAGKSTVTAPLVEELEAAGRVVTVLDTVPVLAKTKGERTSEGKLLRKAFVAGEVARHGGITICVTVSARRDIREKARALVGPDRFVEVYFDVPLEVAQARRKSRGSRTTLRRAAKNLLRPLARQLSDRYRGGYEPPTSPEVTLNAVNQSPDESVQQILTALRSRGFLATE